MSINDRSWLDELEPSMLAQRMARRRTLAGSYEAGELMLECPCCRAWPGFMCQVDGQEVAPHPERVEAVSTWQRFQRGERAAREADKFRQRLVAADVPGLHIDTLTEATLAPHEPLQEVRRFMGSEELALVLVGARGVGKSLAAGWAVGVGPRRRAPDGPEGLWIHGSELAALDFYGEGRLERINRAGILVVDDLGAGERGNPSRFRDRMETLWCLRFDRGLQTIATANMSCEEFVAQTDERVLDRLRGRGCLYSCNSTLSHRSGREGSRPD